MNAVLPSPKEENEVNATSSSSSSSSSSSRCHVEEENEDETGETVFLSKSNWLLCVLLLLPFIYDYGTPWFR